MSHRGPHPDDESLFAPSERPRLRRAVHDLSWLRTRGYGDNGALKLVGDRYRLRRRQRNAVARSACTDAERAHRAVRRRPLLALRGRELAVDAFNVIITLEGALGGAYVFRGRDEAYRDVDPVQGTYRIVEETVPALQLVRTAVQRSGLAAVDWRLDASVSNVGRLKARIEAQAPGALDWTVHVQDHVDAALIDGSCPVATSDSGILDRVAEWCALERHVLRGHARERTVCDLRPNADQRSRSQVR
jgi:hypothetical protein